MNEREELLEFLKMLDFKKLDSGDIEIVTNRFSWNELPQVVKVYLEYYFTFISLID